VRALINSRRLDDALLQLARIDARAELRSAVHSARATYQRRITAIQRELRKDHADLIRAQLAAPRLVALCNGLQYSSGGQVWAFGIICRGECCLQIDVPRTLVAEEVGCVTQRSHCSGSVTAWAAGVLTCE